jgi:hypothetical protein
MTCKTAWIVRKALHLKDQSSKSTKQKRPDPEKDHGR